MISVDTAIIIWCICALILSIILMIFNKEELRGNVVIYFLLIYLSPIVLIIMPFILLDGKWKLIYEFLTKERSFKKEEK